MLNLVKVGLERSRLQIALNPLSWIDFDNCSLVDCISLVQSVLNSPHAYSQNKAFTKHIFDALMQSYEEKIELEVSIPRKLYDEWNQLLKLKLKIMNAMLYVIWVLVFQRFQKLCVMC